jgi:hypothetical protein
MRLSPNKHMLCAETHKVFSRERLCAVPWSAPRAGVLMGLRTAADVDR